MRHIVRWMSCVVVLSAFALQSSATCTMNTLPADGAIKVSIYPTLKWTDVGATQYDIFLGVQGSGACSANTPAGSTFGGVNEFDPPQLLPDTTYEWKVRPMDDTCAFMETSCLTFTTVTCPASAPVLSSPADNAVVPFGSVTLAWSEVPDAANYEIFAGLDGDPLSSHGYTTDTSKEVFIEPGRSVQWYIAARGPSCDDVGSATRTFTTTCPASGPALQNPPNNSPAAVNQSINFDWFPVAGAAGYDLKVSDDDWATFQVLGENLTETNFAASFPTAGTWEWEVRANFNGDCDPLYSERRAVVVGIDCSGSPAPEQIRPANNATSTLPVTFAWTAVANAESYTLFVQRVGTLVPRTFQTGGDDFIVRELEAGTYRWWVSASFADCPDAASDERFLVIESDCPTERATLVTPAPSAVNVASPVAFDWNPVDGAIGYRLFAAIDGGSATQIAETTDSSATVALTGSSVFWSVQTLFAGDCSTVSEPQRFTLVSGGTCTTTPPTLLTPANGSTNSTSPTTFSWTSVSGATHYSLFAATGDEDFDFFGTTEATSVERILSPGRTVKWFIVAHFPNCPDVRSTVSAFFTGGQPNCPIQQILLSAPADNASVTSPVNLAWSTATGVEFYRVWVSINDGPPVNIARTTTGAATVSLPAGRMTWYVEGHRGACEPVVSDKRTFTVARGATCDANVPPTLLGPTGTVTSPVTLQWSAVPNAIGYRVWMSRDGVAFEDVKLTTETSLQVQVEVAPWLWFVQAFFDGCEPRESARGSFTVAATTPRCPTDAPSIIAPANDSTVSSPVTFQWTAVAGAEKYRVIGQLNGGDPILLGVTTETQLRHEIPPGVIDWGVEAVFDDCPSTFSPRTRFTVPRGQNCPTIGAELVAPADNATNLTSPIDFRWNAVDGATRYVLVVRINDGAPTAIARTTETSFTHAMPPGLTEWWVITFFAACEPVESAHFHFTTVRSQSCGNREPLLLLPGDRGGDIPSPVHFQWTKVPNATGYKVWLRQGENEASVIASTEETRAVVELPEGTHEWFVEADFESCEPTRSAIGEFTVSAPVACGTPRRPVAQVVGQALSGTEYRLRWTPLANVQLYEVQESTTADFADAQTFTTGDTVMAFTHEATTTPVKYLYRVRGVSDCNDTRGGFSEPIGVFVIAPRSNNASTEIGFEGNVVQKVFLPGSPTPQNFVATADKPWLTITPSEGTLPAEGITLTVTADPRVLALGTNTGTIRVEYSDAAGKGAPGTPETHAGTTTLIPLSVSLVTPVVPSGKGTPPPDSLIFAVVGHAQGANDSLFESDIRVTNLAAKTMKYQLNFTPSGVNGTTTGSSSTVEIAPNATLALDDIVASLFGTGTISSATGMLEVRPLTTSSSASTGFFGSTSTASTIKQLLTAASSRTYNFTPNGTFGQFIPATRFSDFVGRAIGSAAPAILSLQQVAQSAQFRANFGFAEGAGKPADLIVRVYDTANTLLRSIPVSLQAGEHKQINGMLTANGIDNLQDGRVEVEVVGGDGKVTAYVSEVDNETNDPLLVSAQLKGAVSATRYVVPGVAYIQNDSAFWVTDVRIFNAGTTSTPATLTFYPQGNPTAAIAKEVTIGPGEIEVIDNILGDLFAQANGAGGAIVVTTPTTTKLTASARTYNKTSKGTYGQYIPGVTPAESVGAGDRALQLLQLEQSSRLRTNIGLSETFGQSAKIEVSVIVPDQLATPVVTIDLQPNEFRQITLGAGGFGLDSVYNARVTVKVVGGNGRVTAYGSAIDLITQDPTYVPAQ